MANTPVVVIAAGGFGREVAWLIDEINLATPTFDLIGFVDDHVTSTPEGCPILNTVEGMLASGPSGAEVVCAIGEPTTRAQVVKRFMDAGFVFATLVHPSVQRSRFVTIGNGSIVCAGTILTTNVRIGSHVIINLDCTIGHDTHLEDFVSLMPGVHVSGEVDLGRGVYAGTGASFINGVSVGAWTVLGAGAVVSSSLPAGQVAVGVPARVIKANLRAPAEAAP